MDRFLVCPECGEVRMKVPSGAVCPNGHGRIMPGVTDSELKAARFLVWSSSLPQFHLEKGKSRVYEHSGKRFKKTFSRYSRTGATKYYDARPEDFRVGTVVARDESGSPRCFLEID